MHEAIEDRVRDRRVAEIRVPLIAGQLARDDRRAAGVTILHHLQEILPLDVSHGGEPPVIEDQDVHARQPCEHDGVGAIGARERQLLKEAGQAPVDRPVALTTRVLAQRARHVGLPDAGRPGDEDVAVFGDPPPGGELADQRPIEFAARRVIEVLEARLGTRGRRVKSRRKAGGQPGHPGHHRELVPIERVDTIVNLEPEACRRCAHRLHARHGTGDPRRHHVTELPPIAAHITEYRCHRRQCPACGTTTLAPLPDEFASQCGPQLTALIAYLTVVCRLPRLVVQRWLAGALHMPMSLGSTQKAWEEASAAVAAPCEELEQALGRQAVLNCDDTGHRTNAEKRWLWTLVAPTFVCYPIAASRSATVVLTRLLGAAFAGVLGTDRLPTYAKYHQGRRQLCWAHFRRNLLSAQDLAKTAAAKRFCREALALQRRLFRLWHRYRGDPLARGGPITRDQLIAKARPVEQAFLALAARAVNLADTDASHLARALCDHHPRCRGD